MPGKVVRKSLVDQVYDLILERIQDRTLLPGDRLNIEELARDFGVSRTPVRETINRLTQEGFVEQKHNVGPSIVQLTDAQARDLIEANAALFDVVFDSIAGRGDLTELQEALEAVVRDQRAACETGDDRSLHRASVAFHKVIIDACPNPILRDFARKTQNQINMCNFAYMATKSYRQTSMAAHEAVCRALRAGDLAEAKRQMAGHNRFVGTAYAQEK